MGTEVGMSFIPLRALVGVEMEQCVRHFSSLSHWSRNHIDEQLSVSLAQRSNHYL